MKISVLVPSYKRPDLLSSCLAAVEKQTRRPDQVVVVLRDTDHASQEALAGFRSASSLPIERVLVRRPGQMAALNEGLERVTGEVVCITDDDTEAFPDWIALIESRFTADPALGGVGGRDHVHEERVPVPPRRVDTVGKLEWFGRLIGNHAHESTGARMVDCLKGCNMSFRTDRPFRFDERLRGDAQQNELDVCLSIKKGGRTLLYDPEIRVNHFLGKRFFGSDRKGVEPARLVNNSHNHMLVRLEHLGPVSLIIYLLYTFSVGDTFAPGLVKSLQLSHGNPLAFIRTLAASWRGKAAGIATYLAGRGDRIPTRH